MRYLLPYRCIKGTQEAVNHLGGNPEVCMYVTPDLLSLHYLGEVLGSNISRSVVLE
jgi:hypothetical protein